MKIFNTNGDIINHNVTENAEWSLAEKFIKSDDVVLELGARYGSTSITVNRIVEGRNIVCVEPDNTVWDALEYNKVYNGCDFNIIKGAISKEKINLNLSGYSSYTYKDENGDIQIYDLWDIQNKYNLKFNTLIADCEGCLSVFLEHYQDFFKQLRLVIVETDKSEICEYEKLFDIIKSNGLTCKVSGLHSVYIKD